jgi:hypothetical protein
MKSVDVLVSAEDVQLPYGKLRDALPWFACMCCEFLLMLSIICRCLQLESCCSRLRLQAWLGDNPIRATMLHDVRGWTATALLLCVDACAGFL